MSPTKSIIFGLFGGVGLLAALQAMGSGMANTVAQQQALPAVPVPTANSTMPKAGAATAAPTAAPIRRIGSTLLEQAIFDAFPPSSPKSKAERRTAKNAADFVAATINSAGHLCSRPIEVQEAAPGQYGVGCVKYRGEGGRANYLIDSRTGSVDEI